MRTKAWYESTFDDDAELNQRVVKAAALLAKHVPAPKRFVDIGCGRGPATRYIASVIGAESVAGVDISERSVAEARLLGIDAHAVEVGVSPLPFPDHSADAVHCGEVIEHIVDTDQLMDEIRRILKPGGVCVLSTPNLSAWHNRIALLLGYQPFLSQVSFRHAPGRPGFVGGAGGGHLRMFTHRALLGFLTLHGFEVLEQRGVGIFELGSPQGSRLAQRAIVSIDGLFTHFPSIACDVMVAIRDGRKPSSTLPAVSHS